MNDIEYRGYRLSVQTNGPGWKVIIYPPNGLFTLAEIPHSDDKADYELVIAQARAAIDKNIEKITEARTSR
jgi:hypothetical protein